MSSPSSSAKVVAKRKPHSRSLSASEIARNARNFETWSSNQGCEQVAYSDLPAEAKSDVDHVFDVKGRLPLSWVDRKSKQYVLWSRFSTPDVLSFLHHAYLAKPELFSETVNPAEAAELYSQVLTVFSAWRSLRRMRESREKWSEADYVSRVYNVFRSSAMQQSIHRSHCAISLPQPTQPHKLDTQSSRVLNAKSAIPDCAIFIPAASIRTLSHSAKSPFQILKGHTAVSNSGSPSKGSSFRYQSTPCAQLPDTPGFEFASSFWEDKKPVHQLLEDAYRQNRMATASGVRHLHSLSIKAPVFGLVWSSATVRAHVDWCKHDEGKSPVVLSAPYPGDQDVELFREWSLDRPSDILEVYLLIRNIDIWTMSRFKDRVQNGVHDMVEGIVRKGKKYEPWRRVGSLPLPRPAKPRKENISISPTEMSSSPEKVKPKARRRVK